MSIALNPPRRLDPDEDWRDRQLCTTGQAHLWTERQGWPLAVHICITHCPVREQCADDTAGYPWSGVVVAGVAWSAGARGKAPLKHQPSPTIRNCPHCRGVQP